MSARILTADRARELLAYDPETGALKWRVRPWRSGVVVGALAGHVKPSGYRELMLDRRSYRAARVVWLIVTGAWPEFVVDHIDGRRDNNCWSNLRAATLAENAQNRVKRRDSASGLLGVSRQRGKWAAHICVNGQRRRIGAFTDKHAAHAAYLAEKAKVHPFFSAQRGKS